MRLHLHTVWTVLVLAVAPVASAQSVLSTPFAAVTAGAHVAAPNIQVTWVAGWSTLHPGGADGSSMEPGLLHAWEGPFECLGDLNGDGVITTSDLLLLLSGFGTSVSGPPDLNGDTVVGTGDLLIFLGVFGGDCSP